MKSIKKITLLAMAALTLSGSLSSCATVFDGKVAESQKRKPAPGEPSREIKVGMLVADILLFPLVSLPVDFATGAIYKPKVTVQTTPAPTAQAAPTKK